MLKFTAITKNTGSEKTEDDLSVKILSEIVSYMKYRKHVDSENRKETWDELIDRNMKLHIEKFPELQDDILYVYNTFVRTKKVFPSMRSFQFAGRPVEINNARIYNCSALPINHPDAFSEIMFLLLVGTGVGFSVQKHHVRQLPEIKNVNKNRRKRYLVGDSIEGWADAVKVLVNSYFQGKGEVDFDFRDIRPKGAKLITSGGKAPGPEPLRDGLTKIKSIFENALQERGNLTKLKPIEVHDIACWIADCVLSGGIRRSATISLFSFDDYEMLESKYGAWHEMNPQRARANNSVVIARHLIKEKEFRNLWEKIEASGSGEPGIYFTNDVEILTNPCAEISLKPFQFCNLTSINASNLVSQEDFNLRAKAASFIGTLQAGYTDFHYLRDIWKETTEKDALIGVSMTGIASGVVQKYSIEEASRIVSEENERVAKIIGINKAARCTSIKPEGTLSCVAGTSSGIHAWHNDYYIRRIRVGKNEAIYKYLSTMHPELIENDFLKPETQAVISVPQRAPEGAITRFESAIDLLTRVKKFHDEWIKPGHREGSNTNNVSVTVSIRDTEWKEVGEWLWTNRNSYYGISVLPYDGGSYKQAPFEDITKEYYEQLYSQLLEVDLKYVVEEEDSTNFQGEAACAGASCEVV